MTFSLYIQSKQNFKFEQSQKKLGKVWDNYSFEYGNFILFADLISQPTESAVRDFFQIYGC